jgi:hypothetical protein
MADESQITARPVGTGYEPTATAVTPGDSAIPPEASSAHGARGQRFSLTNRPNAAQHEASWEVEGLSHRQLPVGYEGSPVA